MKNNKAAVINNMEPTKTILPVKKDSTSFSNNTPTTPTGMLDINTLSVKSISSFLNFTRPFMISEISFLKTYIILIAVAM